MALSVATHANLPINVASSGFFGSTLTKLSTNMVLAAGPGVKSQQDYTMTTDITNITVTQNQGDTLDTFKCVTRDVTSAYTIAPEDDIAWVNANDQNGFPTVNLLTNSNFSGPYTSGIASGWTFQGGSGASFQGVSTLAAGGTTTAQSIVLNNFAINSSVVLYQNVTLPTDENQAVIAKNGYVLSAYFAFPTPMTGVSTFSVTINWYDSTGTYISNNSANFSVPSYQWGWQRASLLHGQGSDINQNGAPIVPPAGATKAQCKFQLQTNSATNSGQMLISAAQFEYVTFANYRSTTLPMRVYNSRMSSHAPGTPITVDDWRVDQNYMPTGLTLSVTKSGALYTTAQKIQISNVPVSNTTIALRGDFMYNASYNYTLQMTYKVTQAFSGGAKVRVGINETGSAGNGSPLYLSTDTSVNPGVSSGWQTLTLSFGPDTAYYSSSLKTGANLKIYWGIINTSSATNAGTVVVGAVTLSASPSKRITSGDAKVINFGIYPTPYCGPSIVGCNYDKIESLYYRQQRYFAGYIRNVVYDYSLGAERLLEIDAVDYSILLNEAPATILISKQADNLSIKQACDYAYDQGFLQGLDYTTYVQNIVTVDAMLFNWQTTRDVIAKIADQSVAAYWVDQHKFLHYTPALASSAPFGISDNPDMKKTYPAESLKIQNDSTNTLTTPVIEGSTQISAPQTITYNGYNTTATSGLTNGHTYTSIAVNAVTNSLLAGTVLALSQGGNTINVTVSTTAAANATTISVNSFTSGYTFTSGYAVNAVGFTLYNSNPVAQVDSATTSGTANTIGISSVNDYSQGYTALIDPQAGIIYFNSAPANGAGNVVIVFRYAAPVIIRLHAPIVEAPTGKVRRKIHHHYSEIHITSQQAAIDRANAELTTSSKPKAIGEIIIRSPYTPFDNTLSAGQAIAVTFSKAGLSSTLYQIQTIETKCLGNNVYSRTLKVGYYRPNFVIFMAQAKRKEDYSDSTIASTVLQDVLSSQDGWALGDNFVYTVSNIGVWGTHAGAGAWGDGIASVLVWG